ncbi:unnamed protein product [Amoebophrya sp. A120]|nr:unnamed protein product [Amoebophrya sp. A120]|eukprot:GSA120T00023747001.1
MLCRRADAASSGEGKPGPSFLLWRPPAHYDWQAGIVGGGVRCVRTTARARCRRAFFVGACAAG